MGSCMQPGNYMMVTELMPRGSLYDILHNDSIKLTFKQKMKMVCNLDMKISNMLN